MARQLPDDPTPEEALEWLKNWDTKKFAEDIMASIKAENRLKEARRELDRYRPWSFDR